MAEVSARTRPDRAQARPGRAFAPAARAELPPDPSRVLVIACGAVARELVAVIDQQGLANVDVTCLPATLHNRPGGIPAAVAARIRAARPRYEQIFVAYADCGTGGLLDRMLEAEGVDRLPGAHCYEFYSGPDAFAALTDEDPATFFLTDFLARNFDRLVIRGLGLDRHPELLPQYFGNYRRLVYLAQTHDLALERSARRAARRLGLAFELHRTGYGDLATSVVRAAGGEALPVATDRAHAGDADRAADDRIAPGARVVAARPATVSVDEASLQRAHDLRAPDRADAQTVHHTHETTRRQRLRRPSVHSLQRDRDSVHPMHRSSPMGR
jgi:hypothetical protein